MKDHYHRQTNLNKSLSSEMIVNDTKNVYNFLTSLGRAMVASVHLSAGITRSYPSLLSLFPHIPDLILLGDDKFGQFQQIGLYNDNCQSDTQPPQFATIGSFSQSSSSSSSSYDGFPFVCYYVGDNLIEESQVNI